MTALPPPVVTGAPVIAQLARQTAVWVQSRGNRPRSPIVVEWTDFTDTARWPASASDAGGVWDGETISITADFMPAMVWGGRDDWRAVVGLVVLHEVGHAASGGDARVGFAPRDLAVEEGVVAAWWEDNRFAWLQKFTPGMDVAWYPQSYGRQAAWVRVLSGRVCRCSWRSHEGILARRRLLKATPAARQTLADTLGMPPVPPLDGLATGPGWPGRSKRYHALGNAVAVPVAEWLAGRIMAADLAEAAS